MPRSTFYMCGNLYEAKLCMSTCAEKYSTFPLFWGTSFPLFSDIALFQLWCCLDWWKLVTTIPVAIIPSAINWLGFLICKTSNSPRIKPDFAPSELVFIISIPATHVINLTFSLLLETFSVQNFFVRKNFCPRIKHGLVHKKPSLDENWACVVTGKIHR